MKCKNCKADNKSESICDAGIACYVLRCGEYGCALNGKTVDKLLRMKKAATNADRIRSMTNEELAAYLGHASLCETIQGENGGTWCSQYGSCNECIRDWLKQEAEEVANHDAG